MIRLHKNIFTSVCCLLTLFAINQPAAAHFPWINLTDYTPAKGAKLKGTIGWGHHYPLDGFLQQNSLESLTLIDPDSKKAELTFTSALEMETETGVSKEGGYILSGQRKPGFYTKTIKGGKRASKQGLEGVLRCSYSHMSMKAVANHGKPGDVSTMVGLPIEIIPLDNPAALRIGDHLNIKVMAGGKPFKGTVYATYAGFSTDKNTYAYATNTDKKGKGRIRILHPGIWLVKVSLEKPYTNSKECDVETYNTSLTFAVE